MTVIRSKTPLKKKLLIISLVLALLWLATEFIFYYPLTGLQLAGKERLKISHGKDEIAIAVTGDIMLGGRMLSFLRSNGYSAPFWYTKKILQEADLAIGNLEGPISETGRRDTRSKTWAYKVSPAAAVALAGAGFGMMTLANNHIRDCGAAGLLETLSFLKKTGIGSAGAGTNTAAAVRPYIRTIRGVRIAVFSFLQPYGNRFNVHYHKSGSGRPGAAIGYLPVVKEALKNTLRISELEYFISGTGMRATFTGDIPPIFTVASMPVLTLSYATEHMSGGQLKQGRGNRSITVSAILLSDPRTSGPDSVFCLFCSVP